MRVRVGMKKVRFDTQRDLCLGFWGEVRKPVSHTRNGRMCQHLYKYVEEYLPALGGGTTPESVDKAKNEKERKEEGRRNIHFLRT